MTGTDFGRRLLQELLGPNGMHPNGLGPGPQDAPARSQSYVRPDPTSGAGNASSHSYTAGTVRPARIVVSRVAQSCFCPVS